MAAPTVSKQDVREALEHFAAQGVRTPGLLRLQKHLGRGSLPRIKRLMTEIQNEQIAPLLPGATPPPDVITAAVTSIWNEMETAVAEREKELEASIVEQREQLAAENRQAQLERDEALARADSLESELAVERKRTEELSDQVQQLERTLIEREAELAGERKVVEALRDSKHDLTAAMTKAEKQAAEREHALNERLARIQTERLDLERRHEKDREASAKALSDMRDIITYQRNEAERERLEHDRALTARDEKLGVAERAIEEKTRDLTIAEERSRDLEREMRALQTSVQRLQEELARAAERTEKDAERIEKLEKTILELGKPDNRAKGKGQRKP